MTIYKLQEEINSKYSRHDVARYHRAILFLVENTFVYVLDKIPDDLLYLNDIFN